MNIVESTFCQPLVKRCMDVKTNDKNHECTFVVLQLVDFVLVPSRVHKKKTVS